MQFSFVVSEYTSLFLSLSHYKKGLVVVVVVVKKTIIIFLTKTQSLYLKKKQKKKFTTNFLPTKKSYYFLLFWAFLCTKIFPSLILIIIIIIKQPTWSVYSSYHPIIKLMLLMFYITSIQKFRNLENKNLITTKTTIKRLIQIKI